MSDPTGVDAILGRLDPEQRSAATAPAGPVLCLAPAGSGKTTTLVARVAVRVGDGVDPAGICAIAFNRRAAEELEARLGAALEPLDVPPGTVRARTFHALGREIIRSAGADVDPLVDRFATLRRTFPEVSVAGRRRLDAAISRLKLEHLVTPADVAADPDRGPIGDAFLAYQAAVSATGGLDFDDLVAVALRRLETDPALLATWRARCAELLVDEVQDVDRAQLRLALILAAPANRIFLVGDDDQSIYGWRLADVRRVLGLAAALPGLRRIDLETNYRCPAPVVERAVRLVEHNRERFAKRIRPRPGAMGSLTLAPDGGDDPARIARVLRSWPSDGTTQAILARTNRELLPAVVVALRLERPFRAPRVPMLLDHPALDRLLGFAADADPDRPLLLRLAAARDRLGEAMAGSPAPDEATDPGETSEPDDDDAIPLADLAAALLAWAVPYQTLEAFRRAVVERRELLARLRRDDAPLSLSTAHGTKGLEFDSVAVLMDGPRFPSARSLREADDPARTLEEERRLAYVAWTRARRTLTLVYDPAEPSRFLLEAFDSTELESS